MRKPVGGPRRRWLAEGVRSLAPLCCRPRGLANANHLNRHAVDNQEARRRDAPDAEIRSPRKSREIPAEKKLVLGSGPREGKRKRNPKSSSQREAPAPEAQPPEAPAPSQTSDSHQQARTSTTGEQRLWPDIPPTWSWNVMPAVTWKPGQTFDFARFLGRSPRNTT